MCNLTARRIEDSEAEKICEETMAENFQIWGKTLHIWQVQGIFSRIITKRFIHEQTHKNAERQRQREHFLKQENKINKILTRYPQ